MFQNIVLPSSYELDTEIVTRPRKVRVGLSACHLDGKLTSLIIEE
jgi:hypothetical protein